MTKYIDVIRL